MAFYGQLRLRTPLRTFLVLLLALPALALAEPPPPPNPAAPSSLTPADATRDQLNAIQIDLAQRKDDLAELDQLISAIADGPEKADLVTRRARLAQSIQEQREAFEILLTGGPARATGHSDETSHAIDWQQDLLEIVQPILLEVKELMASRRREQTLRERIENHKTRLAEANEALARIRRIDVEGLSRPTQRRYQDILRYWEKSAAEHAHLAEVARLQLDEWVLSQQEIQTPPSEQLKLFFDGRGGAFLLTLSAGLCAALVMGGLRRLLRFRQAPRRRSQFRRIFGLIYGVFNVLIPVMVMFLVAQWRGDKVVLGSLLLLLMGTLWVLKNSIPQYINELKLMLNLGPVREEERVLYKDVPWKVVSLNVFGWLQNPLMSPPAIRVHLRDLEGLQSRVYDEEEAWFPCAREEWVLLGDGTYGQVRLITPERVVMRVAGGSIKTYGVGDFLGGAPRNLSAGFAAVVVFGIDYKYQKIVTTQVPTLFAEGVRAGLEQSPLGQHLASVAVEFDEAAASSLNVKIIAGFRGAAAGDYYPAHRLVHRLAVDVCNAQGWEIPFTQVTVHQARE